MTSYEPAAAALEEESVDVVVVDRELVPDEGQRPIPGDFESRPVALLRVDEHTPTAYCRTVDLGFDTLVSADIGPESLLRLSEQELRARVAAGEGRGRLSAGPMYGESETMCEICRLIASAAPSSAAVLITGESGVGKELVSEAIHRLSPRRSQPFVAVDCGAIPENLIESELFGHEEGAFTGATSSRKGRFERADGGTLFLDEVGELPPNLQVKLLRVLEEQSFERVGGSEKISVDVRIVSATNRDLAVEIERDAFRRDLFFRLNVLQIDIPPRHGGCPRRRQPSTESSIDTTGRATSGSCATSHVMRLRWPSRGNSTSIIFLRDFGRSSTTSSKTGPTASRFPA
ncbi:MAG: sigma-54 factor interaction domain-containing protein [Bradymonadaceae bacterium]